MVNLKKLGLTGIVLGALLAFLAPKANAGGQREEVKQPNQPEKTSLNLDAFNRTVGDFVFVTDYMHRINRNEKTNINALIKGGDVKSIYVLDPSQAIKSRINFMHSPRAKEFYSEEQRFNLISRYQNFLNELKRQKIAPSKESLEQLSTAVMDGTINPKELKNVEDNIYAIVKEGVDRQTGPYSVFYLTALTSEITSSQYQAKIKQLENAFNNLIEAQKPELSLEPPIPPKDIQKEEYILPEPELEKKKEEDKKAIPLSFFFDFIGGPGLGVTENLEGKIMSSTGMIGLNIGIGIGNHFALAVNGGYGFPEKVGSKEITFPNRVIFEGKKDRTDFATIGISAEAHLPLSNYFDLFLGAGPNVWFYTEKSLEKMMKNGNEIKSNSNSVSETDISGRFYLGAQGTPKDSALLLGAGVLYDTRKGLGLFGRIGYKPHNKYNGNKRK